MAIVLFALLTHYHPYSEEGTSKGFDLFDLLQTDFDKFWEALLEIHGDGF